MGWSKRLMLSASFATLLFFLPFQNNISASSVDTGYSDGTFNWYSNGFIRHFRHE